MPLTGIEAQAAGIPCFFSKGITEEVKIIENVHFLSLDDSLDKWCATILCNIKERTNTYELIKTAGYDLGENVKSLDKDDNGNIQIPNESEDNDEKIILDEYTFRHLLELYFINISNGSSIYLDYNIEINNIGCTFGIHADTSGTVKKLDIHRFTY